MTQHIARSRWSRPFPIGPLGAIGLLGLCVAGAARAHMPYLLPNAFHVAQRDHVAVVASFSEALFVPDVALNSENYGVRAPDGRRSSVQKLAYLEDLAAFEVALPARGTYRISTGERLGRKSKMQRTAEGRWKILAPDARAFSGGDMVDVQSVSTADVYVSRGKPDDAALAPSGKGVELRLLTHPSRITAGIEAHAEVLFQGEPLPGARVEFFRGTLDGQNDGQPLAATTDAQGKVSFTLPAGGIHLALIRHRTESPAGAQTPWRSYTYTLTFEAIAQE